MAYPPPPLQSPRPATISISNSMMMGPSSSPEGTGLPCWLVRMSPWSCARGMHSGLAFGRAAAPRSSMAPRGPPCIRARWSGAAAPAKRRSLWRSPSRERSTSKVLILCLFAFFYYFLFFFDFNIWVLFSSMQPKRMQVMAFKSKESCVE